MTNSFDNSSSKPTLGAGRYDKLQEGGKATRFTKGVSGNPKGRPRNSRPTADIEKSLERFRSLLTRA